MSGDAAFPITGCTVVERGMTLRDYFAGEALPKVIGSRIPVGSPGWQEDAAWAAYSMADAMIRARTN